MKITTDDRGEYKIIRVVGKVDAHTSGDFDSWVDQMITPPAMSVILDCSELDYISSAGLRVVLKILKLMKAHGYDFNLCAPQDHVKDVFDISGFATLVPVFNSLEDCLQSNA